MFGDWVWYRFGVKCMLLFNEAVVLSGGVAVSVWTGSTQLRTQVCWLSRGERLERAVPLRYHLADEVGGESKRRCSTCALALCRLVGALDLAGDEGE